MQDILASVYDYCERYSHPKDEILTELERVTHLQTTQPRMLSGLVQGMFLQWISTILQPAHILEIGTFTGYSAICLAKGLPKSGKLISIDINPETLEIAQKFVDRSGLAEKIVLTEGNAAEIIPDLPFTFDLAFIDADKENYPVYYELIKPKMKPGGIIILDNMLWSGKVLDDVKDAKTKAIHDLNIFIHNDHEVENLLLPIRDGLHIVRKK